MALPRSLDVELEAVTPLWIGGASYQSELRAPSVRGCLRFWLRALLGGVLGEGLDNLRAAESAVYGNMQQASTVVARLTGTPRIGMIEKQDDITPGLSYMLWSVFQQKRDAILPGERFRLRLQNRPLPFPPLEVAGRTLDRGDRFELALASLWLLLRLGGVGARARRGAGGMRAVAAPEGWPDTLPPLVSAATTPGAWAAELGDGIRRLRRFARWQGPAPAERSSFDLLHENACQLSVVDRTFESWSEALN